MTEFNPSFSCIIYLFNFLFLLRKKSDLKFSSKLSQTFPIIVSKKFPKIDLEVSTKFSLKLLPKLSPNLTSKFLCQNHWPLAPHFSCIIYCLQLMCHSFRPTWLLHTDVLTIVVKKWNKDYNFVNLFRFLLWLYKKQMAVEFW